MTGARQIRRQAAPTQAGPHNTAPQLRIGTARVSLTNPALTVIETTPRLHPDESAAKRHNSVSSECVTSVSTDLGITPSSCQQSRMNTNFYRNNTVPL